MKIQSIVEDSKRDVMVVNESHKLLRNFINLLSKTTEYLRFSDNHIFVYLKDIPGFERWSNLCLVFSDHKPGVLGRFFDGRDHPSFNCFGIQMYMLDGNVRSLTVDKFVERILQFIPTFVHEFTHYKDALRDTRDIHTYQKATSDMKSDQKYFNSNEEFNAFYQDGAGRLLIAYRHGNKKFLNEIFNSFQEFVQKELKYLWDTEFLKHMRPATKKRFMKRVYQLWTRLKKRYQINTTGD